MTNLENPIPQPDPLSDYYITWHKLLKVKCLLEKLINYVGQFDDQEGEVDETIESDLAQITRLLDDVLPAIETE